MTTHCKACDQPHELFYWVGTDKKRVVSYICHKVTRLDSHGHSITTTGRVCHTDQSQNLPLEEKWSPTYAKKKQQEKELQLPLMRIT